MLQFDEPAFNVYLDEVRDWGVAALDRAVHGLGCRTAVHICYGYGIKANIDWKQTLGGEWRQYEQTFPLLARSRIGQVSLECANSRVPLSLIGLLAGKDVLVGASTSPPTVSRRPRRSPRRSAPRWPTCPPSASTRAPTAAWCRCPGRSRGQAPGARGGRGPGAPGTRPMTQVLIAHHAPPAWPRGG